MLVNYLMRIGWIRRFVERHSLWQGMVWGIAQLLGWFGILYSIRGDTAFAGPSLIVLRDFLSPVGGLRAFGVAMAIAATAATYAGMYGGLAARNILRIVFVCFLVLMYFSIAGGIVTKEFPPGFGVWLFGAIASIWLSVKTPRGRRPGGRDDRAG